MILLVDHDPEFLEQAREVLNSDRRVMVASSAAQAIAMVESLGVSVVLVELNLPDGALALIRRLREINPGLLVIGVRAGVTELDLNAEGEPGFVHVLQKPVSPAWKTAIERVRAKHPAD